MHHHKEKCNTFLLNYIPMLYIYRHQRFYQSSLSWNGIGIKYCVSSKETCGDLINTSIKHKIFTGKNERKKRDFFVVVWSLNCITVKYQIYENSRQVLQLSSVCVLALKCMDSRWADICFWSDPTKWIEMIPCFLRERAYVTQFFYLILISSYLLSGNSILQMEWNGKRK